MSTVVHASAKSPVTPKSPSTPKYSAPSPSAPPVPPRVRQPQPPEPDPFARDSAYLQSADTAGSSAATATVRVTGRNVEVPDHFRVHVSDKLARLERYDSSIYAFDVELHHERNRRQAKVCQRLEITVRGRGPVVRAEARAENFYAALETAVDRLESRLRRSKERRQVHHGSRTPISVARATAQIDAVNEAIADESAVQTPIPDDGPGRVVRIKEHPAKPMTVDDALYEMELVGHDFFLFHDVESDRPSVVYRRHAFDYGLIRLA